MESGNVDYAIVDMIKEILLTDHGLSDKTACYLRHIETQVVELLNENAKLKAKKG